MNPPVELFDGASTYLLNHPSPPDGFRPVAGQQNIYVYPGQHETVRANTGTMVNGVPTATVDISGKTSSVDELASLLVHETFHVFQGRHYPDWGGNEMDLFTYPVDGYVFAQPLIATNVTVQGAGVHDLLYIVTEHDTIYAFDADNYIPTPCWTNSLINAAAGVIPLRFGRATPRRRWFSRGG